MATLKFRDTNGDWQYAPSLKYKDKNGAWQTARNLKYKDANGIWHRVCVGGSTDDDYPTIGTLTVGSTVYLLENGSPVEYLIVHKGLPDSTLYDVSCDGVWLLRKDLYISKAHNSSYNDYSKSEIYIDLNNNFVPILDDVQSIIKEVKIPYTGMSGSTVYTNENGLLTKAFVLGHIELGFTSEHVTYLAVDGAKLDYFDFGTGTTANNKRISKLNGVATQYTTRSAHMMGSSYFKSVSASGASGLIDVNSITGVRPALILPYTAKLSPNTNTIIG